MDIEKIVGNEGWIECILDEVECGISKYTLFIKWTDGETYAAQAVLCENLSGTDLLVKGLVRNMIDYLEDLKVK